MALYAFRLPKALVDRLDAYVEVLQEERPESAVTRADALRKVLDEGLTRHQTRRK